MAGFLSPTPGTEVDLYFVNLKYLPIQVTNASLHLEIGRSVFIKKDKVVKL